MEFLIGNGARFLSKASCVTGCGLKTLSGSNPHFAPSTEDYSMTLKILGLLLAICCFVYCPLTKNDFLRPPFSREVIKRAVWDFGSEKTTGPDGFTFGFIKCYWDLMADDVFSLVEHFHHDPLIPSGCNPLFISLIPKVNDPKSVKDFRPISLIGCQAKIIGKLLANRLAEVVSSVVGIEQSAFIKGRQILDGPLMLNEIVGWSKAKKRQLMGFKVDFEKAYDSVSWDYLFEVMGFIGFGDRWSRWIRGLLCSGRASVLVNGSPTEEFIVQRGLRQGDPLSPSLLILIMKGLHIAFKKARELNAVTGF
ncbi:RNA-directed DNA polymerase, eukaryota [Tanacetum coccineum]|uniref:RNA-directed DNA polymerase, eukaryota n=1 Tax=Tanacetum coccineum TaxID=301880 RepID=A0ABQ5GQX2_9ASTR